MKVYSHLVAGAIAAKEDIQIQTSFRYLKVVISGAAGTVTEAELKTALLSWTKAGSKGNSPLQNKISLYTLAEINASREGLFLLTDTAFQAMIEVGDGAAIGCDVNNYISLNFEGFQTDWNVDIYTVDDIAVGSALKQYVLDNINNRTQSDLDLRGVKDLYIPVAALSKLYLTYNTMENGQPSARTIQFLPNELHGLMMLSNEIVLTNSLTAASSLVLVSEEFYGISVRDAVRGTIEFVAAQTSSLVYVKSISF